MRPYKLPLLRKVFPGGATPVPPGLICLDTTFHLQEWQSIERTLAKRAWRILPPLETDRLPPSPPRAMFMRCLSCGCENPPAWPFHGKGSVSLTRQPVRALCSHPATAPPPQATSSVCRRVYLYPFQSSPSECTLLTERYGDLRARWSIWPPATPSPRRNPRSPVWGVPGRGEVASRMCR
jgi:hypothetical protein